MSLVNYTDGLSLEDALKLLNQAVQDQHTSRYFDVAAVTVMLYDILITMDQEVSLIWNARWSYGKILYFITRYPVAVEGILWLTSSVDLNASEPFEAYLGIWATLIFLIPLQIVIILRTIAIWERRRPIIYLLVFSLFATDIIITVTLSRIMGDFTFSLNQLLRPILGCNSGLLTLDPTTTIPAWAGVIAFDTVLFVLTLARGLHSYRIARTHLLTVLLRDGFAYYCVMLALGVSNLILLSALPISRAGIAVALTPVLRASYSVIGSRLVLNLRGAASTYTTQSAKQHDVQLVDLSSSSNADSELESGFAYGLQSDGTTTSVPRLAGTSGKKSMAVDWRLGLGSWVEQHFNSTLGFEAPSIATGTTSGDERTLHG